MAATYMKLKSGEWGIRVEGKAREGGVERVRTKAGELKEETVARVLFTGPDKNTGKTISICAIHRKSPTDVRRDKDYRLAKRNYEQTGDYYGSGLYDEES